MDATELHLTTANQSCVRCVVQRCNENWERNVVYYHVCKNLIAEWWSLLCQSDLIVVWCVCQRKWFPFTVKDVAVCDNGHI